MKIARTGLPLCLWAFAGCVAAADPEAIAEGLKKIQVRDLQADLTFLASGALEGRLSLRQGSEAAIAWIASEFLKAGLAPAAGGSYLQRVPLIEFRPDNGDLRLTIGRGRESRTFRHPDISASFPEDLKVDAGVAFAGYGITAPELAYDDYAGLDVHGRIVLVFDHEPQETDPRSIFLGTGNTRYATSRVKALNAQRRGAAALLVGPEPNRKHPTNQERMARIPGSEQRRGRLPSQAIEGDELRIPVVTVNDTVTRELLAVAGRSPSELQSAIDASLKPSSQVLAGVRAEFRYANRERRRGHSANVAGLLEGSDPRLREEYIIYSAHHDHDGTTESGGVYHGADDDGSGTVGVVALARAFGANRVKPRRSTVFLVFAAEERGLLGSYYYAQQPLWSLEKTRAVVNFDMIGRNEADSDQTKGLIEIAPDTSNEMNLIGTKYCPAYRKTVEAANEHVGLRLNYKWDEEAALNIYFRSDQFPFALKDVPAVWWFTGFHPDYHQTTDTVDRIHFEKMARILALAYRTGWEFGDGEPPSFVAGPAVGRR